LRPRWVLLAILVGVALHLPSLFWGLYADDYGHEVVLRDPGASETMGPLSLYEFGGTPEPGSAMWESGALPWFTSPDWEVRFLRPLASLARAVDSAVWGERVWGMHLTGLLLFALLEALVFALYRALSLSPRAALFGLVLFAVEDGAVLPVGWLAQRNSLLAALFTVAALLVAARAKRPAQGARWAFACLLALCACACKESGVVAFALLAVFALWRRSVDPGALSLRRALAAAGVALGLAGAWVLLIVAGDYGANSLFYPVLWESPGEFAARGVRLLLTAPLALVSPIGLDALFVEPSLTLPTAMLSAALLLAARRPLCRLLRDRPAAPFLAVWVLLSLLPQAGAPISDRLLMDASVGAAGLLGLALSRAPRPGPPWRRAVVLVPAAVVLVAVAGQALSLLGRGVLFMELSRLGREEITTAEIGPPGAGQTDVIALQFASSLAGLSAGPTLVYETERRDVRFSPLQFGRRALGLTRVDSRTLDVTSLDEPFLRHPVEEVLLTTRDAPRVGTRWHTAFLEVEALAVDATGLRTIRITAAAELDSPSVRLLACRDGALRAVDPPAIGETLTLPRAPAPIPMAP
jgi:hypothetical protein